MMMLIVVIFWKVGIDLCFTAPLNTNTNTDTNTVTNTDTNTDMNTNNDSPSRLGQPPQFAQWSQGEENFTGKNW